ncbi:MAG: hypothetical protein D6806_07540 [Deltaproteobacteria bacterium]|nr:MAG: hypothetical protein D6806_07540 [Deltaproteobacteria bacterium]
MKTSTSGWFWIAAMALVLLLPASPAGAWGPATHLELGMAVLKDLACLAPAIGLLIRRYPLDFLYGNLAADITVGKDLAPYALHCHNWQVARTILELAEEDSTRAFAWGYLAHLAADVVAHNYFVPFKMVQHYHRRRTAHTLWELQVDTWVSEETWSKARTLSTRAFKEHDRHLKRIIVGPLFSFPVNKQIFNSFIMANRMLRYRRAVRAVMRQDLLLEMSDVDEIRRLSLGRMRSLLSYGLEAPELSADPTGHRNLLVARQLHHLLYRRHREGMGVDPEQIERLRKLFRDSVDSTLELPPLDEIVGMPSEKQAGGAKRRWHVPRLSQRKRGGSNAGTKARAVLKSLKRAVKRGPVKAWSRTRRKKKSR